MKRTPMTLTLPNMIGPLVGSSRTRSKLGLKLPEIDKTFLRCEGHETAGQEEREQHERHRDLHPGNAQPI